MIDGSTRNVLHMISAAMRYRILAQTQLICMHATVKYVVGVKWLSQKRIIAIINVVSSSLKYKSLLSVIRTIQGSCHVTNISLVLITMCDFLTFTNCTACKE